MEASQTADTDQWYEPLLADDMSLFGGELDASVESDIERENKHDYALKMNAVQPPPQQKWVFQIDNSKALPVMEVKPNGQWDHPSSEESYHIMSKNAIAARENRIKKKRYVQGLEKSVLQLTSENEELRRRVQEMEERTVQSDQEVTYLRGILANAEEISQLVRGIRSSMSNKRRPIPEEGSPQKQKKSSQGVCLHVNKGEMSLEFCHHCSRSAQQTP